MNIRFKNKAHATMMKKGMRGQRDLRQEEKEFAPEPRDRRSEQVPLDTRRGVMGGNGYQSQERFLNEPAEFERFERFYFSYDFFDNPRWR